MAETCVLCARPIAVFERAEGPLPGLLAHKPCHDSYERERARSYRVTQRSALGYPLRFEVNADRWEERADA